MPRKPKTVRMRPEKIGELIDIYNYAPANAPLKSQKELEKEAQEATKQHDDKWSTERKVMTARFLNNAVIEQAANYPKLNECISNQALFGWRDNKKDIYFKFLYFREKFNQLLENAYSYCRTGRDYQTFIDSDKTFIFGFSDLGKYQVKSVPGIADIFAEALEDVEAHRIRRCAICRKIFWAKTTKAGTCGNKKCADDLGNKKRLDEAKELREKQNNHFQPRVKK